MAEQQPRIRRASLPADVIALVRGDTGEPDQDRRDALAFARRYADWPGYGVSGFYAVTDEGIDDLASDLLQRFRLLRIYDPGRLVAEGLELLPTFRTPHVTLGFTDLDHGLAVLAATVKERRPNPYHGR